MTPEAEQRDELSAAEAAGRGVVNLFTVERDTSLADGAGAPGSTSVGGMRREDGGASNDHADSTAERPRRRAEDR